MEPRTLAQIADELDALRERERELRAGQRAGIRKAVEAGATYTEVQREARVSRPTISAALRRND